MKKYRLTILMLVVCSLLNIWPNNGICEDPLGPKVFVRKVVIHGNHPYLKKKILRLSSVQPGDVFEEENIAETEQRLSNFFIKDGYLGTTVKIDATPDEKMGFINISINIQRGPFHRIGQIDINGNEHMDSRRIKNKIGQQARYSPVRVKQKLRKIEDIYVDKGFIRTRIKLDSAKLNTTENKVDLNLSIKERRKFSLDFKGNKWFRDSTLKSQTTFFKERTFDRESIFRSRERLLIFYQLNGFRSVKIDATIETSEEAVNVHFEIEEGPRTRLKQIILEGKDQLDKSDALEGFKSETHSLTRQGFYREAPIEDDLTTLVKNYHDSGYFDMQVLSHDTTLNEFSDQAILSIQISEGSVYELGDIRLTGVQSFETEELLKRLNLKSGKNYNAQKITKGRTKLLTYIQEHGYPLATLQTEETIHPGLKQVDLTFSLQEGPKVTIKSIVIQGLYFTHESVVRDAIKFKEGDLFSYKNLLRGQFNLKRMDVFDHVSITPVNLNMYSTDTDILIVLKERKRLSLDVQAGFDSDKLGNGEVVFTQRNIFGIAKHIQLRGQFGFELSRAELNFISPRLFGASWNLINQYFVQQEDDENFDAFSYGGSIGVFKNFGPDWTVLLKAQITRFDLDEFGSNNILLSDNLFDNTFAELIASVAYDSRNSYVDPTRGIYTVVSSEVDTDLSDITNDFFIFKGSLSHYLTLIKNITFSSNFRISDITVLNAGTRIPATKLFFLGGNDTIRGFNEDVINRAGGTTRLITNFELAFRFNNVIQLAGFMDIGSLTNGFNNISTDAIRESAGVGLRYITPVGPIRLDYGFILDRQAGEPLGRLHFTFGYFF